MKITPGKTVTLEYELLDEEGNVLDQTEPGEPVVYSHGENELIPGLERALEGRKLGDSFDVTVEPEDAYGPVDPEGFFSVPRSEFPDDVSLRPGEYVSIELEAEEGDEDHEHDDDCDHDEDGLEARVVEVTDDAVTLDGNHPLAGRCVTFRVRVIDVR